MRQLERFILIINSIVSLLYHSEKRQGTGIELCQAPCLKGSYSAIPPSFFIKDIAANCEILQYACSPLPKLDGSIGIDFEANSNDSFEIVELNIPCNLSITFSLNYDDIGQCLQILCEQQD